MTTKDLILLWNTTKHANFRFSKNGGADKSKLAIWIESLKEKYGDEHFEEIYINGMAAFNSDNIYEYLSSDDFKDALRGTPAAPSVNSAADEPSPAVATATDDPTPASISGGSISGAADNGLNAALSMLTSEILKLQTNAPQTLSKSEIEAICNNYLTDKTTIKLIDKGGAVTKINDLTHKKFETVLKLVNLKMPVLLVGPAGSGKNVLCQQIAKALNLDFYFTNAVTQEFKITGYADANGRFVETQFYQAFKNGGLFMLDEIDASCPESLVVLNCAIANGYFDFPGVGFVKAHPDFRVIAAANTYGTGADLSYVGRNQLDAATLDRFSVINIDYDKRIEKSVCPDDELRSALQQIRAICNKNGTQFILSYRGMNSVYNAIFNLEIDPAEALKICVFKGLEKDTLRIIAADMSDDNKYKNIVSALTY